MSRKHIKQYELGWRGEPYRLAGEVIEVEELGAVIARAVEAGPVRTAEMFPAGLTIEQRNTITAVRAMQGRRS